MESIETTNVFSSKQDARASLKLRRKQTSELDFVADSNESIHQNILKLIKVLFPNKSSVTIASYMSFGTEVSLDSLNPWARGSHNLVYPRVVESGLAFYKASKLEEFEKSSWGVMEPKAKNEQIQLKDIDLMLIPGIGFSRWGHRLGYGQGHYDRSISDFNGVKVGINFKSQIIEQDHFFEPHDVAMDYVVTDEFILQVKKG